MEETRLSRRRLVQLGLGVAAKAGLISASVAGLAQPAMAVARGDERDDPFDDDQHLSASINAAYAFLDQMMDAYAPGDTVRLSQSYADQIANGQFFSTAFTYDNALLLLAYLTRGRRSDFGRAQALGNALLYAQKTDPAADGRLRQPYFGGTADANGGF